MVKDKQYKSDAMASIHQSIEDLHDIGLVDKKTMRHFDEGCLEDAPVYSGEAIKKLRAREQVSQPIFALYLNVSKNLVSDWERNIKKPSGPALRLLSIVEKKGLEGIA